MAKYGNHLNTIIKKATYNTSGKLSDLPEIIRPYQYNCGDYDPIKHEHDGDNHTKVGFIGSDQDMAYYFDFPDEPGKGTIIQSVKDAVKSPNLRSPMIFRKYLEQNFRIYEVANVGNQSMSFSFADYETDICFVFNNKDIAEDYAYANDVKNNIFYIYYYPTQKVYIFIGGYRDVEEITSVYLKFTPRSKLQNNEDAIPLTYSAPYTYTISNNLLKDISCYQIYYKDSKNNYYRIPNEYIESITYQNRRTLNSQQIAYFTKKTLNPEFIKLDDQQITIKFYNIDKLKNRDTKLYLYVSDVETDKNDHISNGYTSNGNVKRRSGAKTLIKKIQNGNITISENTDKTNLIYNILKEEELVYQDHLYFDINSAELYFEIFNDGTYNWLPYAVDKNTSQKIISDDYFYLRIDYFLNDDENEFISSGISFKKNNDNVTYTTLDDLIDNSDKDKISQDNTENIPFFNYSDTFADLPTDELTCTDVVFVKNSTNVRDSDYNDTDAFKATISPDFVINENDLSYKIVKNELEKVDGDNGYTTLKYTYKSNLRGEIRDKIYSNEIQRNIVSYSKALVDDLNNDDKNDINNIDQNGNTKYEILSNNIKNFISFLNVSMDDGDDVNKGPIIEQNQSHNILSIQYNSNYDYFILKNMGSDSEIKIDYICFGIGHDTIDPVGSLAANAIYIDVDDRDSYLPFIQYIGKDIMGRSTWYIPNFNSQNSENSGNNISQVDISFNASFGMNIKGFYF